MLERDGKLWTVEDIDRLEKERDEYKARWEIIGRISKKIIDLQTKEIAALNARLEEKSPS
jgi:hypothetical protein